MFVLFLLAACDGPSATPQACDPAAALAASPAGTPGAPYAGAAEAFLRLPVGTPLSGYTTRCGCFGGGGRVDHRDSAYTDEFAPSAGVQTPVPVKATWISNGDQDLVVVKIDLIYSFDGLVAALERRLSETTGRDLRGKVVVATGHSHHAYGDFSDQVQFYLGSDNFNYEIFSRVVEQSTAVAMQAHDSMVPARIGVGLARDWDPEDRVYRDRRDTNDGLQVFPDLPAGPRKDPTLSVIRVDAVTGEPIAVLFDFGIHGTVLDVDNAMVSTDAPGHVERALAERFDTPVVVALLQGGAGDASPAGEDSDYARLESLGVHAADSILALWERTPTSDAPIRLETATRAVSQLHDDIRITRNGTVDLRYTPYTPGLVPDNEVYGADGSILSPIDEFNVPYGAAFCGESPAYLPGFAPATAFPYAQCVDIVQMTGLIKSFFDLTDEQAALPLRNTEKATVTATRIGPVPIAEPDGTTTTDDVLLGFFPGEPTAMYTEQFHRRAASELGYAHSIAVGYAQDHEGYLLIPEDWLQGGYEADINVWGPLQGEHLMEQLLTMAKERLSTERIEPQDPCGEYPATDYVSDGGWELPGLLPDLTPEAGEALEAPPDYLWSPLYTRADRDAGILPSVVPPSVLPRVQGLVEFAWRGGDPAVDYPVVTLQRQEEGGAWVDVTTPSGRPVALGPEILLSYTPAPLAPPEALQTHTWLATWQAVGSTEDRAGLPLGTYRLHVEGDTWAGGNTTWPWSTSSYTVDSTPFQLEAGRLDVVADGDGLLVRLPTPARGYRLVDLDGDVRGTYPVPDDLVTLTLVHADGTTDTREIQGVRTHGATRVPLTLDPDVTEVRAADRYGNAGAWTRESG
jgi:neutral ceramidase